jgi:deltex-like protein
MAQPSGMRMPAGASVQAMEFRRGRKRLSDLVNMVFDVSKLGDETCTICLDPLWSSEQTPASGTDHLPVHPHTCPKHIFHLGCIRHWLRNKALCPVCRTPLQVCSGYQPPGCRMAVAHEQTPLPGFHDCGTLVLHFAIPAGTQSESQPLPGEPYAPFQFTTFLPDNSEGQHVLEFIKKACNRGLLFRIGQNQQTRRMDTVVVNGINFKVQRNGGAFARGFPDPHYLSMLKADLSEVGIH